MDAHDSSVSSWLSDPANAIAEAQLVTKSTRSKSGQLRCKAKAALISTQVQASLDRSDSQVSTLSLDSSASAASTSSAAGTWSPRTAADVHSRSNAAPRKSRRIRASSQHVAKQDLATVSSVSANPNPGLLRESSPLSAASFDSDANTEPSSLPRLGSNLSPTKPPRRGPSALPQSQHSILDPLPEKPTDVVRQRKVFGSTYSVGMLGELPYVAPPRTRSSLTQPPWVASARRQAATDEIKQEKLVTASSLETTSTVRLAHGLRSTDSGAGPPVSLLEDRQDVHAHVPGLPSILDPPSAPTDPHPAATQAGQLLHSFNLLEPAHDESLSPKTTPVLSSAPAVLHASQVPDPEGYSGFALLPPESAPAMLPIPLLEHGSNTFLPYDQSSAAQYSSHAGQIPLHPSPAVHTTTAAPPAAASDDASGIWQAQEHLSALPEMQPVKPAMPLLVKSASSVSQQSILSYGRCIREFQLEKLGEGKPDIAAAEDQPVTLINSSQSAQSEDSMDGQQTVAECPQQSATARDAVPQLWLPPINVPSDQTEAIIDDAPQLSVSAVLQRLQSAAPVPTQSQGPPLAAVAEPPPPKATALPGPPQLAAIATAMPPGSPTGAVLPGTGSDLLQRPGSSPLPVSKMLRMVSEEQGTLLSDLAAQCAAPGGLLGTASKELGTASRALSSPAQLEPVANLPAQFASTSGRGQQAQHTQHGQGSVPMSPVPEEATKQTEVDFTAGGADISQQASAGMSASISADQANNEVTVQMKRSPLRKRLSQIFSPVPGSSSSAASNAKQQQQPSTAPCKAPSQDQRPAQQMQETAHTQSQVAQQQTGTQVQTQQAQQRMAADVEPSGHVAQLDCMEDAQHSMRAHTASMSPRALRSPSPPFRPLVLLSGGRSSVSLHEDLGHLVQSPATHVMARSLSEIVQQLYANDQLSQDCAHALSMQLGSADSISRQQMQANAELLQRCLARLMLWKNQLLQHCMDHESAMRQYCMDVESAMSSQEQRLMGQAANNLQQRDAALTALHRVEDEVLHLKATVADLHEQLDDKDDFEDSAHLDKESWGEFFALHQ
ncbi:hypothetical protein WJX77_001532 [Trebouxia sp. C0004]